MHYGLLGGKLGHSLSPQIHRLFFDHTGIKGSYELLETPAEQLARRTVQLRSSYRGCNVTIPHKVEIMKLLDVVAPEAQAIGAVNTVAFVGGRAMGYNTDYFGFARMLESNGIDAAGKTAAVLGSGGAARAVVKYFADIGTRDIYLVTRSPQHIDRHFFSICPQIKVIDYDGLLKVQGEVIVNCTPVGMYPDTAASPVREAVMATFGSAVDLIYNPRETLFLKQAAAAGKKSVNGLFMLVAQAVAAQEIWQRQQYDSRLIYTIMQELEQSL